MVARRNRYQRNKQYQNKYRKFNRYSHKSYSNRMAFKTNIVYIKRTRLDELAVTDAGFQPITINARDNDYRLQDVPNYTDITNMYDEYKICGIKHKFVFERPDAEVNTTNKIMPTLITVNDYNTAVPLANEDAALEYSSCKINRLDMVTQRYFRPNAQFVSGLTRPRTWVSTTESDLPHLGMLMAVVSSGAATNALGVLKIYTTFYVACRRAR